MNNMWLGLGDASADNEWGDGGLSTNEIGASEGEYRFGENPAPVPWEEWSDTYDRLCERAEQLRKVCRALTDITDAARSEAPEFYKKFCAQFVEGEGEVRPEAFLIEEYCPRGI